MSINNNMARKVEERLKMFTPLAFDLVVIYRLIKMRLIAPQSNSNFIDIYQNIGHQTPIPAWFCSTCINIYPFA